MISSAYYFWTTRPDAKPFVAEYKPGGKEEKLFFKNHLSLWRGGLSLRCPTRTGRLGGCQRSKPCVIAAFAILFCLSNFLPAPRFKRNQSHLADFNARIAKPRIFID
jgi:hypothetical protein